MLVYMKELQDPDGLEGTEKDENVFIWVSLSKSHHVKSTVKCVFLLASLLAILVILFVKVTYFIL